MKIAEHFQILRSKCIMMTKELLKIGKAFRNSKKQLKYNDKKKLKVRVWENNGFTCGLLASSAELATASNPT
jgi:hypothetical protein